MTRSDAPRFSLPGTWARIDLANDGRTRSSVRKAVERVVGRDDKLAAVRAELRSGFIRAADVARTHSATDFYVALELAPGVPLPAWLSVFLPHIEVDEFERLGLSELKAALGYGVSLADGSEKAGSQVLEAGKISAVRQVFHREAEAVDGEPPGDHLQVDYWLAAAKPNRIALLSFSTNFVEFEVQMLELFDAVIGTARWPVPVVETSLEPEVA